ncbi:MAG: DNA internalization-related competence protein ComEC/Rec2 [Bacilli bacterium]|nr:DNA internalization-related competence protein ComEC/Rec2 [Bacilli bacterium]
MRKLKIILKSKYFFIFLFLISVLRLFFVLTRERNSIYDNSINNFTCTVIKISKDNVYLDCKEIIIGNFSSTDNLEVGQILNINGVLNEFNRNTNFNLFDYKEYMKNNSIFYRINVSSFNVVGRSKNILLNIRNVIYKRIKNLKSFSYLNTFILGDKSFIDDDIYSTYKELGVVHLFSISGMHISFFLMILNYLIKKNSYLKSLFFFLFLFFYYRLVMNYSLLRAAVFFFIREINNIFSLRFSKYKIVFLTLILLVTINPLIFLSSGIYYSLIISFSLYLFSKSFFKSKNKIVNSFIISFFVFIMTIPLNIYIYSEIFPLSIIYNTILIPLVTFFLFPLSILTLFFPFLDTLLFLINSFLENLLIYFRQFNLSFVFIKPSIVVVVIYYLLIILTIYKRKITYILLIVFLIHFNYNLIFKSSYLLFFDVRQGDSFLIHNRNKTILIDTGGLKNYSISNNTIIPVLKSFGIRKIDYFIISHGDYDHMGEAINLVNNFKVEKVIFNCGPYNDLEKELIKVLDKKKIPYYTCIKELNIDNNKLHFLQTKKYDNENDNSNVIYTELKGYKFMFMGDASSSTEKEIMDKYNLSDIDVLKVGHHGSKTSSSEEFIEKINPKYSIISVGKKNRYGHPNKEVLDTLSNSKVYRTDLDGSIMFKIKNNKLKIETCSP